MQTYAAELGVRPGDRITLNGWRFTVTGLAVTAAWPSVNYSGLIWLTTAGAASLATAAGPLTYALNLKLADPAAATAFANAHGTGNAVLSSWQQISSQDAKAVLRKEQVLVAGSWLLAMVAIASVAVLVGGRMAEQTRRVGLLKAVGGTPRRSPRCRWPSTWRWHCWQRPPGWPPVAAAPLLTSPADGLIGAAGAPSLTAVTVGVVAAVALAVALLATFVPPSGRPDQHGRSAGRRGAHAAAPGLADRRIQVAAGAAAAWPAASRPPATAPRAQRGQHHDHGRHDRRSS